MRPQRPGSAKTQFTRLTQDSEHSKNDLNSSKFSQTFSSGVNSFHEKPDEFKQYVKEKDKDPKFKHLKSKLDVIQEKAESSKPSFKPFQKKKKQKATDNKTARKSEQEQNQKPEDSLRLSRGFAGKNKQKLQANKLSSRKEDEGKEKDSGKGRPNFDSFTYNKPNQRKAKKEGRISIKPREQTKPKQQKSTAPQKGSNSTSTNSTANGNGVHKPKKTEQELRRQQQMRDIEKYVSDVEVRNMDCFPTSYDRAISRAEISNVEDLQKIDLKDFMADPTQEDYEQVFKKIQQFDKQLDQEKIQESIDLQQIVGDKDSQQGQSQRRDGQVYLESLSASQLKKRNAFITQILGGKLSTNEIGKLQEMEKSSVRVHKLEREKEESDDIQFSQINMVKRQSNRLLQRNRVQASGQLYRDCDYLTQEQQQRLEFLLTNDLQSSPFEFDELQRLRQRGVDEGIRMYRELQGLHELPPTIDDESLPKDPELKKEAEKKVLREKIASVNQRLGAADKMTVTKAQIQTLIKQYEITRASPSFQALQSENQRRFEQEYQRLKRAEEMLESLGEKQNVGSLMNQLDSEYQALEAQIKQATEMDAQELMRMEKERLRRKLREVEQVERANCDLEREIQKIDRLSEELALHLQRYQQAEPVQVPELRCEGYAQGETLQDIDAVISRKYQSKQQPVQE